MIIKTIVMIITITILMIIITTGYAQLDLPLTLYFLKLFSPDQGIETQTNNREV